MIIDLKKMLQDEYENYMPPEICKNIGRTYYRGIAFFNDDTSMFEGAIVWEFKDVENSYSKASAEIKWFTFKTIEAGESLFSAFNTETEAEKAEKSFFEINELTELEKEILTDAGYTLRKEESQNIYVTIDDLNRLPLAKRKAPGYVLQLAELMPKQVKNIILSSVFHNRYGLLEDISYLPMNWYDMDISCCVMTDGNPNAILLVHENAESVLVVDLLFGTEPDAKINILNMICLAISSGSLKYGLDKKVMICRHTPAADMLAKKLFPNKHGEQVYKGERS